MMRTISLKFNKNQVLARHQREFAKENWIQIFKKNNSTLKQKKKKKIKNIKKI